MPINVLLLLHVLNMLDLILDISLGENAWLMLERVSLVGRVVLHVVLCLVSPWAREHKLTQGWRLRLNITSPNLIESPFMCLNNVLMQLPFKCAMFFSTVHQDMCALSMWFIMCSPKVLQCFNPLL